MRGLYSLKWFSKIIRILISRKKNSAPFAQGSQAFLMRFTQKISMTAVTYQKKSYWATSYLKCQSMCFRWMKTKNLLLTAAPWISRYFTLKRHIKTKCFLAVCRSKSLITTPLLRISDFAQYRLVHNSDPFSTKWKPAIQVLCLLSTALLEITGLQILTSTTDSSSN